MKRSSFVKMNQKRWEKFEQLVSKENPDPDLLADLFIQVSDDLAFSSTQYPDSDTTKYLNHLAARIHQAIYKNKKEEKSRLITFWTKELPLIFYVHRRTMLISFIIFSVAILIGVVSAANDQNFVRLILGDAYVDMTLENIEKGQPMGVYGTMAQHDMFFAITFNNIKVSFVAFVWGGIPMAVFLSFGTGFILLMNGIMLGAFHFFFFERGLLAESMLTIWLHGTIEISSIIIAGAAGIVAGNGFLFPGTYRRFDSFKMRFKDGLKMIVGLIPLFIIAGFIESFITRLYNMPDFLKLTIILGSLFLVLWYFVYYPYQMNKKNGELS